MFEQLFQGMARATNPFQGFLGEVWNLWTRDVGRAVLVARQSWQKLPSDITQRAAMVQQQAQAAQASAQIDQQVNVALGSMGIFPGLDSGSSFGFGMNPDHAMFIMYMGLIRANSGDPPVSPQMIPYALPVLTGKIDPIQGLVAASPMATQQQLAAAAQMMAMMGMDQLIRVQAVVQAALALPRAQIPSLLPDTEIS
jgi:hypothetical protein